jgi:acyl-CoA thioester hydrolase
LGVSYKDLENSGILLPVSEYNIKYILPALYDEQLSINCAIKEITEFKIKFDYKTHKEEDKLLNFGSTTLVFVDRETKKPVICPNFLINELLKFTHKK